MSPVRRAEPGTAAALAEDLAFAAGKRLPKVFIDRAADVKKYPTLARIVSNIEPKLWEQNPTSALQEIMRHAIKRLPDEKVHESLMDTCTWQQAGRLLFFGSEIDNALTSYSAYCKKLQIDWRLRISGREFGRITNNLRVKITKKLVEMEAEAIARRKREAEQATAAAAREYRPEFDYVRRDALYAEIDVAIAAGHKIIGLVGDGGVGKSTLAKHYAQEGSPGSLYVFADFRNPDDLVASIYQSFVNLGISTDGLSKDTAWLKLRDLFADPERCPRFIVIDGVEDNDQVQYIEPFPKKSSVLITTRDNLALPTGTKQILVGELTEEELYRAVRVKLPDVSAEELESLKQLHGRVLAIDIACTFMRNTSQERRNEFATFLQQRAVTAVGHASTRLRNTSSLESLYKHIIHRLESDRYTAPALSLLELEVACDFLWHLYDPAEQVFARIISGENEKHARQVYQSARDMLIRYHVVHVVHNEDFELDKIIFPQARPQLLRMHPLTAEILLQVFSDFLGERCALLMERDLAEVRKYDLFADEILSAGTYAPERDPEHISQFLTVKSNEYLQIANSGIEVSGDLFFKSLMDLARSLQVKARSITRGEYPGGIYDGEACRRLAPYWSLIN